jgi:hypothetical protein
MGVDNDVLRIFSVDMSMFSPYQLSYMLPFLAKTRFFGPSAKSLEVMPKKKQFMVFFFSFLR